VRHNPPLVRIRQTLILAAVLALAGCNGSDGDNNKTTATGFAKARGCSSLTAADVAEVTGEKPNKRDLASSEEGVRCSTAFFRAATELVVSITERDGDARALKRLRAAQVAEHGAGAVRPASGLGEGAFVANKRTLGFQRGDSVVILETGYAGRRLVLTASQLEEIARMAAQRL